MADTPISFGRYNLVERLAVGGMAELYIATAPGAHGFQKKVVIKRLLPHLIGDETYNAMFIDEAKLTARLVHPKIAQTFELGKVGDSLFIAMEHVEGIDVLALLREFAARKRRFAPQLAAWIAHEVLDALDYAHNLRTEDGSVMGVVHRDISPSNILLSLRGDIKLVDFGIARAKDSDRAHKSKSGTLKGKYGYMSPEQVLEQPLDARSDLFSVGVVLAELLTGRRLFAAPNELDVLLMVRDAKLARFDKYGADVEPMLAGIVRRALKKPVDERWQSAAEFRDGLSEWLYEHRHRVTPKQIADVVEELRGSVLERRERQTNVATAVIEEPKLPRKPSDTDGTPMIMIEAGDSMPVISVSYEQGNAQPRDEIETTEMTPIAVSERPSRTVERLDRLEKIELPKRAEQVPPPRTITRIPPAPPPGSPPPTAVLARVQTGPLKARTSTASIPRQAIEKERDDAVIEVPIADTISAAVEAITLPESILSRGEDSQVRAFDDLTEEPPQSRSKDIRIPTPEEVAAEPRPTPPALAEIAEPPDDSGEFSTTPPMRVLFRLMTARATGLLVVAVGGIKKDIYVRDGQPEYVSSNVASELFGNYLVSKGVLSDGELAMALAMMPHYGGKLGDTLVGLGLLKPLEVFRHLTRQVRSKIIDVCTWNKGTFGWYAGRENPREAFPLDFNAFEILGAGALAISDDQIDGWVAKHAAVKLRTSRTRKVGPERFEVPGLAQLFELLDGTKTIGSLVERDQDRAARLRTGRMLFLLDACDLAKP
ncbi:MAG: serine/threonine protein kinase [Kofleriaceae bacterium]